MVDSKEIIKKEKEFIVPAYGKKPIVIVEGKDTIVKDADGNEYIDCLSGISVTNAGHCPDRLVRAGQDQMAKLIHCSGVYHNIPATLLAEKIAGITPSSLTKSFFVNSGAEAVEGAVKIAKKFAVTQGRTGAGVIALEGSFHGRLGLSLTLTGQAKYKFALVSMPRIIPNNMLSETKILDATPGIIAKYAINDEQSLLAKLRYNRLIDIFTGITSDSNSFVVV